MAMPFLTDPAGPYGFDKGSLSIVLSLNAVAYALSKFLMGERFRIVATPACSFL